MGFGIPVFPVAEMYGTDSEPYNLSLLSHPFIAQLSILEGTYED